MQRVVSFYEKLPRGSAPEIKPSGLLGRYQARYFGKNPSAARESLKIDVFVESNRPVTLTDLLCSYLACNSFFDGYGLRK